MSPAKIAYRETIRGRIGHGRHVKQSGGHGQYAICDIEISLDPHTARGSWSS